MSQSLAGKVALVTGAGRRGGIGAAVCRALAARGADVLFSYWKDYDREMSWDTDEDGPEALLEELRGAGVRAEGVALDLSLPESPERLLDAAEKRLGPPSILVNNAAHSRRDGFEKLGAAVLDAHYAVNLRATALLCAGFYRRYAGGPGSRKTRRGSWHFWRARRRPGSRARSSTPRVGFSAGKTALWLVRYHVRAMKKSRNPPPKLFQKPPKKLLDDGGEDELHAYIRGPLLPRPAVYALLAAFGVSLMLAVDWFGLLLLNREGVVESIGALNVLRVMAILMAGIAVPSALLMFHYRLLYSYISEENVFFAVMFALSSTMGLPCALVGIFG